MIRHVPADGALITGPLDTYDWLMIGFGVIAIIVFFIILMWILALPGKIALQRNHPHAETVKIMGYAGMLPVFPWIHAFIWAFHDSVTVDIRRFPKEEREAIERELAALRGENAKAAEAKPPPKAIEVQRVPAPKDDTSA